MRAKVKSALGVEQDINTTHVSVDDLETDEEDEHEEQLMNYLEMARTLFKAHKLNGSIEITKSMAILSRSVALEIEGNTQGDESGLEEELSQLNVSTEADTSSVTGETPAQKQTKMQNAVKAAMRRLVKSLMKRSTKYKSKEYRGEMELSAEAAVSGPVFGLLSVGISISASVEALNTSFDYTLVRNKAAAEKGKAAGGSK